MLRVFKDIKEANLEAKKILEEARTQAQKINQDGEKKSSEAYKVTYKKIYDTKHNQYSSPISSLLAQSLLPNSLLFAVFITNLNNFKRGQHKKYSKKQWKDPRISRNETKKIHLLFSYLLFKKTLISCLVQPFFIQPSPPLTLLFLQ